MIESQYITLSSFLCLNPNGDLGLERDEVVYESDSEKADS